MSTPDSSASSNDPVPRRLPKRDLPGSAPEASAPEGLEALGERIAELAAYLEAATYRLLVMLREFDERSGWDASFRSCAHWLQWRTGLALGAAREKVRVAHALAGLPRISAAMETGEVSYSKVRAMTRVATAANEEELLYIARDASASELEKVVRLWRRVDRLAEAEQDERRQQRRSLQIHHDEDGMVVVRARLTPEAGAALLRALDAARDRLFEESGEDSGAESGAAQGAITPGAEPQQRQADALALVAESALAGGLDPGTRGDRYQVVVHVEAAALPSGSEEGGAAVEGVADVSAETSRRLACDAAKVEMVHAPDGSVLDVGRRTRTIPPALRRALAHRDGGCRFPGCAVTFCEAHHVEHWADGGTTKLDNLVQLCRHHHRALHEDGFTVELAPDGSARFRRPEGREITAAPAPPPVAGDPFVVLEELLVDEGLTVAPELAMPGIRDYPPDYGSAVEWLRSL